MKLTVKTKLIGGFLVVAFIALAIRGARSRPHGVAPNSTICGLCLVIRSQITRA